MTLLRTTSSSPIPRSPAISRCVRPLVCTRRTASSSNSFVNRRCCVIEFLIAHGELSTFPKQVQLAHLAFEPRDLDGVGLSLLFAVARRTSRRFTQLANLAFEPRDLDGVSLPLLFAVAQRTSHRFT